MADHLIGNIYRLDIPLPNNPLKNLNSYFIRGEERSLLIDTGFRLEACREALHRELNALGADLSRTDIFLTHMHADHSGLAPEVVAPGRCIYISETDRYYVERSNHRERWEHLEETYMKEGFSQADIHNLWGKNPSRDYAPPECGQYRTLRDGDVLSYGGYEMTCVLTPGHTPGHMCLHIPEEKAMILGDHVLFKITPNIVRWDGFPNALGRYLESLDAIKAYDIRLPLPAHRLVLGTVEERVEQIKEHHAHRIEEAYRAVAEHPGMSAYDVAGFMKWDIRATSWAEFPITQKWFAVGEAMSHLEYLVTEGRIRKTELDGRYAYYPWEEAKER